MGGVGAVRFKRLAEELQMRRRRLTVYQASQPWPGKGTAWRFELAGYDGLLLMAAEMLEVAAPALERGDVLAAEVRAALEDRLAVAGLDVYAVRPGPRGGIVEDGDLCF
jgi:hypothetical protein